MKRITYIFTTGLVLACASYLFMQAANNTSTDQGGNQINYWENGQIREKGLLIDGKREGTWMAYYPNGERSELGQYANGLRHGTWTYWRPDGSFDRLEEYPPKSSTDALQFDHEQIKALAQSHDNDAAVLALCAEHVFVLDKKQLKANSEKLFDALQWVDRAIAKDPIYPYHVLRVKIIERYDYRNVAEAAKAALELGQLTIPNFNQTQDHESLQQLAQMKNGC